MLLFPMMHVANVYNSALLSNAASYDITGGDFVDCSECVQLILEILVGNSCSCNFTYILRLPEESHQVVHRGDEVQERKRDDDGNYHTAFIADHI